MLLQVHFSQTFSTINVQEGPVNFGSHELCQTFLGRQANFVI